MRLARWSLGVLLAAAAAPAAVRGRVAAPGAAVPAPQAAPAASVLPERLTPAEFARLVAEFSEPGGYFLSDNLVSNETGYVPVLEKLRELHAQGGAYVGVGPEQNFTYVAAIRPRIAFIVDVRSLAVTHHLMYKALFALSATRAQFLSRLLSRPAARPSRRAIPLHELLDHFDRVPGDATLYTANLAEIERVIRRDFSMPFTESDRKSLAYLLSQFRDDGLQVAFRLDSGWQSFPSLREVIAQADRSGKPRHFLASAEDYDFLRQMQLRNLIVPINGDFGGKKALASVGDYLRGKGLTVTAFYVSNVEQYLFGDNSFDAFVRNVRRLPLDERSLFIRSVLDRYMPQAQPPRRLFTMLLQRMPVFLRDYDEARYRYYHQLVGATSQIGVVP